MKKIKKLSIISILSIISLLQTGCARLTIESTVNKDRTVDITYLIASKTGYEAPLSDSEALKEEFEKAGYKSSPYKKDEYTGYTLSKTFNLEELCENKPTILSPLTVIKEDENVYTIKLEIKALIPNEEIKETFNNKGFKTAKDAIESDNGYVGMIINLPYEAIKDNANYKKNNCTSYGWYIYAVDREVPEITFDITKSGKATPVWKIVLTVIVAIIFMAVVTLLNYMGYLDKKKEAEN